MNKLTLLTALLAVLLSQTVVARDTIHQFPIEALLATSKAKEALYDVPMYFGDQSHPAVKTTWGEVMSNKKTNAFMKSDREACEWVMLSALKALQERAQREGMDAVINIHSYYKKRTFVSETEYECGAGNVVAGVTLKGTLVKLK